MPPSGSPRRSGKPRRRRFSLSREFAYFVGLNRPGKAVIERLVTHIYPVLDNAVISKVRRISGDIVNSYHNKPDVTKHHLWSVLGRQFSASGPNYQRKAEYVVLVASYPHFEQHSSPSLDRFRLVFQGYIHSVHAAAVGIQHERETWSQYRARNTYYARERQREPRTAGTGDAFAASLQPKPRKRLPPLSSPRRQLPTRFAPSSEKLPTLTRFSVSPVRLPKEASSSPEIISSCEVNHRNNKAPPPVVSIEPQTVPRSPTGGSIITVVSHASESRQESEPRLDLNNTPLNTDMSSILGRMEKMEAENNHLREQVTDLQKHLITNQEHIISLFASSSQRGHSA